MNNTLKKIVMAGMAIALLAPSLLEAKKWREKRKDPIIGTWNISIDAQRLMVSGAHEATEETTEELDGIPEKSITLEGVATFHDDCTVVIASVPKNPQEVLCGIFSTMSYGVWKRVGDGRYKVLLSSVTNPPGRKFDFRGKTHAEISLFKDCKTAVINGVFSTHDIDDLCFSRFGRFRFKLCGEACKIFLCPKKNIK